MTVLLIAIALGFFVLGYACMGRIDRFVKSEISAPPVQEGQPAAEILLFGAGAAAQDLARRLEGRCPDVRCVPGPDVPEYPRCKVLLALSEDDRANLLVCSRTQRFCPEAVVVARCNDPMYRELFADTEARRVLAASCSAEAVLGILRGLRVL